MHDRIEKEEEEEEEKQAFQVSRVSREKRKFRIRVSQTPNPFPFILAPGEERSRKHFPDVYFLRETETRVIISEPMLLHWRG